MGFVNGPQSRKRRGYTASLSGDHLHAVELVEQCLEERQPINSKFGVPYFLSLAAQVHLVAGNLECALACAVTSTRGLRLRERRRRWL